MKQVIQVKFVSIYWWASFIIFSEVFGELFAYTSATYPYNVAKNQSVSLHITSKDSYNISDEEMSTDGVY